LTARGFHIAASQPTTGATVPDARGRLFYLPRLGAVLTAEYRTGDGYRCAVLARCHLRPQPRHVLLSDTEIAAAPSTVIIDVDDVDAVAMIWLAQVWQRWRAGLVYLGGRTLAEDLRIPGTLVADIDRPALVHLATVTRLRAPGIACLLQRLLTADLLAGPRPNPHGGWGSYTLRLPDLDDLGTGLTTAGRDHL
jgi:hypothetical protein